MIYQYQEAVLYRGGKFRRIIKPGFHWKIPIIDNYHTDTVTMNTMKIDEVNITTLDSKTVIIGCEFDLIISDIYKALNDTHDWHSNLRDISRGILSDTLEDLNWDDIRKKTTKNSIAKKIEKRALEMGITTSNFNFTDKAISRAYKLFNNNG